MHPVQAKAKRRRNALRRRREIMAAWRLGSIPFGRVMRLLYDKVRRGGKLCGYTCKPLP